MPEAILDNGIFCCAHISLNDEQDIKKFTAAAPSGEGLADYIRKCAIHDEKTGLMRTYIVRDKFTMELAGYFSLKAGLISHNEQKDVQGKITFDAMPGIELADFAVNGLYIQSHPKSKGTGFVIFNDFIRPIAGKAAEYIGARILYIFALPYPKLIKHYQEKYGFVRLPSGAEAKLHGRIKPIYDKSCVFMYQLIV